MALGQIIRHGHISITDKFLIEILFLYLNFETAPAGTFPPTKQVFTYSLFYNIYEF